MCKHHTCVLQPPSTNKTEARRLNMASSAKMKPWCKQRRCLFQSLFPGGIRHCRPETRSHHITSPRPAVFTAPRCILGVPEQRSSHDHVSGDFQSVWDRSEPIGWNTLAIAPDKDRNSITSSALQMKDLPAMSSCSRVIRAPTLKEQDVVMFDAPH